MQIDLIAWNALCFLQFKIHWEFFRGGHTTASPDESKRETMKISIEK